MNREFRASFSDKLSYGGRDMIEQCWRSRSFFRFHFGENWGEVVATPPESGSGNLEVQMNTSEISPPCLASKITEEGVQIWHIRDVPV